MKKDFLIKLLYSLGLMLFMYLLFVFGEAQFNIANWSAFTRTCCAALMAFAAFIGASVHEMLKKQ